MVAGQDRARPIVVRPGAHQALGSCRFIRRIGGEDQPPGGIRSWPDDLGKPLAVVLDEADGALDHRDWAAVVHLEVDASQAPEVRIQGQHAADVGQAPAVDRLVVVADEEDPAPGAASRSARRSCERSTSWTSHEQVPAALTPACQRVRSRSSASSAPRTRSSKSSPPRGDRGLVGDEGPRERSGLGIGRDLGSADAEVELQPRERRVEPAEVGRRRVRPQFRHQCGTVQQRLHGQTGIAQDLAAQGMEGTDPNRADSDTQGGDGRVQAFRELLAAALVEGDEGESTLAGPRCRSTRRSSPRGWWSCPSPRAQRTTRDLGARSRQRAGPRSGARGDQRPTDGGPCPLA